MTWRARAEKAEEAHDACLERAEALLVRAEKAEAEVERLAARVKWFEDSGGVAVHAAYFAKEAEVERLTKALKPFAMCLEKSAGAPDTSLLSFANWHEAYKVLRRED